MGAVTLSVPDKSRLVIGPGVSINDHTVIVVMSEISIGRNVMIADFVSLRDHDHGWERADVSMRDQGFDIAPIVIEDEVWIGRGVSVLKGVRIGRGAVIGANAAVTRDIPPNSVAVGVPARVIAQRGRGRPAEGGENAPAENAA
jgi:acetyltransferase-like isoleucine patch superfamily enzyme